MKLDTIHRTGLHDGELILVNESNPLKEQNENLSEHLCEVAENVLLNQTAAFQLTKLMNEVKGRKKIIPVSAWRSRREQEQIYTQTEQEKGHDFTQKYVATPGCSEHQTGLAIDMALNDGPVDFIRPAFPYWGIAQEFRDKAPSFGFIERYQKGKEHITGIGHEPWHFRYVGIPHAEIITEYSFVLEEYHDFLAQFANTKTPFCYQAKRRNFKVFYLGTDAYYSGFYPIVANAKTSISGNNRDGFVITEWGE